ncbi:sterile alpha motif domain-containing 3 [Labeo rohita]|uniref:Sterile alpha motif domain-containing 3 n=1 Tax=Labeo rohita TaxID=84645 RepID=A0A498MU84_LABRO|nr:sterile alpha motif domain-containing 3 [Labeo rohita]
MEEESSPTVVKYYMHHHAVLCADKSDTQSSKFGVKGDCVLREALKHFHPVTGFAPDILHDLLEVLVSTLPDCAKVFIQGQTTTSIVYTTSRVTIDGTDYAPGMFVSAEACGGLPQFWRIDEIFLVNNNVSLLCSSFESWYVEHVRCYELSPMPGRLSVFQILDLNDTITLAAYFIDGRLMLSPRRYILQRTTRKITLASYPESTDELKNVLREKLDLDKNFTIQYEDPDFDGQLVSLVDINELPPKATVKLFFDGGSSSTSTTDSELLTDVSTPERVSGWPQGNFPVPAFSYEVEHILREGNSAFEKTGKVLQLTRDQKHDVLEKLAAAIYNFKAYPSDKELSKAAEALVTKHPCLKELGSDTGWFGWKTSIKFKMGNYRNKLRRAGCMEVAVNAGKRSKSSPDNEPSHLNIKRARRAEVNYLPDFPQGHDASTLEQQRVEITEEVQKAEKNLVVVDKKMQMTFALRRNEIITSSSPVKEILGRWPALRLESQVCAEFQRITNQNLTNTFYAELDRHSFRLMTLYRQRAAKTGKTADALAEFLRVHDLQDQHDVHTRRTTVLCALPVYLREDTSKFFKTCTIEDDSEEPDVDSSVALLTVVRELPDVAFQYNPEKISIILENEVVITNLQRLSDAFLLMFGLIYALDLSYPKEMANTFEFIQKVLLGLDDGKLKPRVLALKNDLLIHAQ